MPCVTSGEATPREVAFLRMFYPRHSPRFMDVTDHCPVTLLNVSAHRFLGRPLLPLPIFASHNTLVCADLCWSILATWLIRDSVREITTVSGSLSRQHGAPSGCGWRNGLQYGG